MTYILYQHPLSSYCQKAKTGFYEKGLSFETKMLDGSEPVTGEFARLWPIGRFPVLTHGDAVIFEATSIIDYIDALHADGARLVPADPVQAVEVRMWDRFFDNYINTPQQRLVLAFLGRDSDGGDGGASLRGAMETAYAVLDQRMEGRTWVAGENFSLADCAAAPALLYADWTHAIPKHHENVWAYRDRILSRPSYARALDEARPYRHMFPLGAPEGRD